MAAGILEYAARAILYSLLAAAMLEALLRLWRVQDPPLAVRFRLLILAIPPAAPLLFALLNPERGAEPFRRQVALLNLQNWLGPAPEVAHPGWALLLAAMAATAGLLGGTELVAWARHLSGDRPATRPLSSLPVRVREALGALEARGLRPLPVQVVDRPEPMACTVGLRRPTVLATTALVELLDGEEMVGVLAHELAHAHRRDNWLGWLIFGLRLVSFYNPVALFAFHQISHDLERVCDADAAASTGKGLPLASALIKVFWKSRTPPARGHGWPRRLVSRAASLEDRARQTLVVDRVERLVHPERVHPVSYPRLRLALAAASVLGVAYLVV